MIRALGNRQLVRTSKAARAPKRSAASAIQRQPGVAQQGTATPLRDARAELQAKKPHLASVLSSDQIEQVQRVWDARAERKSVSRDDQWIVMPMEKLLSDDVLPGGDENPRSAAFKEMLYKELIRHPVSIRVRGDIFMFDYVWGPHQWTLGERGGQITFATLMRIQTWNIAHSAIIAGDLAKLTGQMAELARGIGGEVHTLDGKKLGEVYRNIWNTDLEVGADIGNLGGYYDDERGHAEIAGIVHGYPAAAVAIEAPDGWTHVYAVKPNFKSSDLREPDDDGFGFVLNDGSETGKVVLLKAGDGIALRAAVSANKGAGWRYEIGSTPTVLEEFAMGAIFGDAVDDVSVSSTMGQVVIGLVPVVGQIADARDIGIGVAKMWSSGGKEGKLQTVFAVIGLVPFFGDMAKAAWKSGGRKALAAAIESKADAIRRVLARRLVADPSDFARRFGIDSKAAKSASDAYEEAGKALSKGEYDKYAQQLWTSYRETGRNTPALVALSGGSWKELVAKVAKAADAGSAEAARMAKELEGWRFNYFTHELPSKLSAKLADIEAPGVGRIGKPQLVPTGTRSLTSDLDASFLGANAVTYRNAAAKHMKETFGSGWRKLLDADLFADPGRMNMFRQLGDGSKAAKLAEGIERRLVSESELNTLAKMIKDGGSQAEIKELASKLNVPWKSVQARAAEVRELGAPVRKVSALEERLVGLKKQHAEAPKNGKARLQPLIDKVEQQLSGAKTALERSTYRKLELQMDVLHAAFEAEKDLMRKAGLAERMASTQSKLNAAIEGPYVTPGGVLKHTSLRDKALRDAAQKVGRATPTMSPRLGYMAVLDDLAMINKVVVAVRKQGLTAGTAKDFVKYAERMIVTAGQHGLDITKAKQARELFDKSSGMLHAARRGGQERLASEAALRHMQDAMKLLDSQVDGLLTTVKKHSQSYRAATRVETKAARASAKQSMQAVLSMRTALREAMILLRVWDRAKRQNSGAER